MKKYPPSSRTLRRPALFLSLILLISSFLVLLPAEVIAAGPEVLTGDINGAAYHIEVPSNWNGTLLLYSHGTAGDNGPNPAAWQPDAASGAYLLEQGFALAGSSFKTTGWAVADSLVDNPALLSFFQSKFGKPKRTIAWGTSQGGIHVGALIQKYPNLVDGALPMCGVMMGGRTYYDANMDEGFAFKTLLAPDSPLQVVNITDVKSNVALALKIVDEAQATPLGRARISLAATLRGINDWYDPTKSQPDPSDLTARQLNQYTWMKNLALSSNFGNRAAIEQKAGGNFSDNVGIDYRQLFSLTRERDLVEKLYAQGGFSLQDDLNKLNNAPRIAAVPAAAQYMSNNIEFNGQISIPVLAMHTDGDGYVVPQGETSYANKVKAAGNERLLNQIYVHRANHCTFTPAEVVTALNNLIYRLDTGQWKNNSDVARLNSEAAALGPGLNFRTVGTAKVPTPSAFVAYQPGPYPRAEVKASVIVAPLPKTGIENSPAQTFPETGYSLSGLLLNFWNSNGGLPVFGFPIDSERQLNGQVFQWFERNRLELHPENQAPYNVELGLLGVETLNRQGIDWKNLPKVTNVGPGCTYFAETGHSLCAGFLQYWQSQGLEFDNQPGHSFAESLALFGFPISEPTMETNSSGDLVLTQWFERARLELHPSNPAPYRVLLGRLGAELFTR